MANTAGTSTANGLAMYTWQPASIAAAACSAIEVGDALEHQRLDAAVERPLVARKAAEPLSRRDAQLVANRVGGVLEVVDHRGDLVSRVLFEQTGDPASPAAQPHDPDAQLAPGGRVGSGLGACLLGEGGRRGGQQRDGGRWPQSAQQTSVESWIDLSSLRCSFRTWVSAMDRPLCLELITPPSLPVKHQPFQAVILCVLCCLR